MLYAFIFYSEKAGYTLHRCLSQFLKPLLFISWAQISMLYSHFYHLSRKNRSYIIWIIKPIINIKVIHLLWSTSFTTTPNPRNPKNFQKNTQKSVTLNQNMKSQCHIKADVIHLKRTDFNITLMFLSSIPGEQITY